MKEVLEIIAKALVDEPEAVSVIQVSANGSQKLELRVAPPDMGKVIGKQGRIAKAIRTVVKAGANREGKKVVVDIVD